MTIDNTPATLSLELYGKKVTWETDHSDLDTDELVNAFYGMLITQGFFSQSIVESMNDLVSEIKNDNE
jgi:hypothetical protein